MTETVDNTGAGDSGTQVPAGSWVDSLPEDIKSDPSLQKFESVETLAKSYINAQQLIGRDKIPMPLTEDDWDNTYTRLGRPETSDAYEFESAGDDTWFREAAHKAGLNNQQATALTEAFGEVVGQFEDASAAEKGQAEEQLLDDLRKEWGGKFDERVANAQRGIVEFADEDFLGYLEESGLGNDPRMIKIFAAVGESLTGATSLPGNQGNNFDSVELDTAISAIKSNPAYLDRYHPEHNDLVKRMTVLMGEKYGE